MNQEIPDVQAGFRIGRGTRGQIVNIHWIMEKAARKSSRKTSASLTTQTPLIVWITTNWKLLKETGIPDHLTCLLRNLYVGQEATVRIGHGTTDWFKIGKGECQGLYCHPVYLTYVQSTSCEMLGWTNHKLESRFLGEISTVSDKEMILL